MNVKMRNLLIFVSIIFGTCYTAQIPSYFKVCKSTDKNLNSCVLEAGHSALPIFSGGVPELGVEPLDPLAIGRINISTEGNGGLGIVLDNTKAHGFKKAHLYSIKVDLVKQKVAVKFAIGLTLTGHYTVNGQILILPIRGDGDLIIKTAKSNCTYKYDFDIVKGPEGKDYFHIAKDDLKCNLGKTTFDLKNLFGGDKALGDTMNRFLNENWEDVMKEVSPPAIEAIKVGTKGVVNKLYSQIPIEDLLPQ